jgi:hypothetical protein
MHVSTIFLNCNKREETYMIKMSFPIRTCLGPSLPFREVYFYFELLWDYKLLSKKWHSLNEKL